VSERGGKRGGLTPKQRRFALEYLVDANATAAAVRAGYSQRSAYSQAHDLLKKPEVRALVDSVMQRVEEETQLDVERVVTELWRILRVDPLEAYRSDGTLKPLAEIPEDVRRAMSTIKSEEMFDDVETGEVGPRGRAKKERRLVGYAREVKFWGKTEASSQLLRRFGAFRNAPDDDGTGAPKVFQLVVNGVQADRRSVR
jgi:phage terminase small subunit